MAEWHANYCDYSPALSFVSLFERFFTWNVTWNVLESRLISCGTVPNICAVERANFMWGEWKCLQIIPCGRSWAKGWLLMSSNLGFWWRNHWSNPIKHQQIQYWHLVVQTNAEQNLGALDVNTISWEMEAVAEFLEHNEDTNGREVDYIAGGIQKFMWNFVALKMGHWWNPLWLCFPCCMENL